MMHNRTRRPISPIELGATLYMPAIREDIVEIACGRKFPGLRSLVLCLEDALQEDAVTNARSNLRDVLQRLKSEARDREACPLLFVRPRNVAMAAEIACEPLIAQIDGFVAPKVRTGTVGDWVAAVADTELLLMPTLETAEVFDPLAMRDLRDELRAVAGPRILALRIGGNDLLSCLELRRVRGATLYEGPLGHTVAMLVGLMVPVGFALSAPVYDVYGDVATLERELALDICHGLVGKTAIHPAQVPYIQAAFRVARTEVETAQAILGATAAVFSRDNAMCEPATHRAWAVRTLDRARIYGIVEEETSPVIALTG